MKKLATFIVYLLLCSNAVAQDEKFYGRHIIIAVDQKMFVDANQKENRTPSRSDTNNNDNILFIAFAKNK